MEKRLVDERKEEVINACKKLYQKLDFKDINIKLIGSEISVGRTSIYNYFQTKEEIFLALLEREYLKWNEDLSSRPEVRNKVSNLDNYDTVLIGFPIWWDLAPTIINTFIEENSFVNKKIYVFATSAGSSVNNSFNTLKNTYSNLNFVSAKRFSNNLSENDITSWIV